MKKWKAIVAAGMLAMVLAAGAPAWATSNGDHESPYDWGTEGAVQEPEGIVVNILQLTTSEYSDSYPAWGNWSWSSDGAKVVYQSERGVGEGEICTINVDGTGFARLTNNDRCDSHASFVWPLNEKIVFQRNITETIVIEDLPKGPATQEVNHGSIWIMNADGTGQTNLTAAHGGPLNGPGTCENNPMVSPDGTKIAFRACEDNRKGEDTWVDLYVMNIDGSNPVKVSGDILAVSHHSWSPDSQWVVFKGWNNEVVVDRKGGDDTARIYKAKADGSAAPVKLSPNNADMPEEWDEYFCENWPKWSPDGKWIACSNQNGGEYDSKAIYIFDVNGGNRKMVMGQDGEDDGDAYDWIHSGCSWSPDSKWLVYTMDEGVPSKQESGTVICISNVYTGAFHQLTQDYEDCQPRWSPDPNGKPGRILFKDSNDGRDDGYNNNDILVLNPAPWLLDETKGSGRYTFESGGQVFWPGAAMKLGVSLDDDDNTPLFIGALYTDNPTGKILGGTFWDLYCPDPTNVMTATLTLYFNNYQANTRYMWFNEETRSWEAMCPDMYVVGVGPFNFGCITYTAALTATITANSYPSLDQLTGTVFATATPEETIQAYNQRHDSDDWECYVDSLAGGRKTGLWSLWILVLAAGAWIAIRRRRAASKS